jgi:hypothetical protein
MLSQKDKQFPNVDTREPRLRHIVCPTFFGVSVSLNVLFSYACRLARGGLHATLLYKAIKLQYACSKVPCKAGDVSRI